MKTTTTLALTSLSVLLLAAFTIKEQPTPLRPSVEPSSYLAEIHGDPHVSTSGEAKFGLVEAGAGTPAVFTLSLGANGSDGSVLFTRTNGTRFVPGTYSIRGRDDGSDEIVALVMTGSASRPPVSSGGSRVTSSSPRRATTSSAAGSGSTARASSPRIPTTRAGPSRRPACSQPHGSNLTPTLKHGGCYVQADRDRDERTARGAFRLSLEPVDRDLAAATRQRSRLMTPDQIRLVRTTWNQVVLIADTAARLFYERLFEMEPELRRLFGRTDMEQQRQKLMQTLAVAVGALDRLETLRPALEALGRRHVDYGVEDRHYDLVGAALLWTLEQGLGDGYTESVQEAWSSAYAILAGIMRDAASRGQAAA